MTTPSQSHSSQLKPRILLLLLLLAAAGAPHSILLQAAAAAEQPITLAGCQDKCGNISIPFPFGIKPGCFREGFQVTCNYSFRPPRAFFAYTGMFQRTTDRRGRVWSDRFYETKLDKMDLELVDVSLEKSEARTYVRVSSICSTNSSDYLFKRQYATVEGSPFLLSPSRNVMVGVGWYVEPILYNIRGSSSTGHLNLYYYVSCLSVVSARMEWQFVVTNGSTCAAGQGCCQAALQKKQPLVEFGISFKVLGNELWETNPCSYGMAVESSWYNLSTPDLYGYDVLPDRFPRGVPVVLDFAIRNGSCHTEEVDHACVSANSYCTNATSGQGYVCRCLDNYAGNPYIPDGCQDIDECELRKLDPDLYPCSSDGICKNRLGGYDCPCKPGMKGDGIKGTCTEEFPLAAKVTVGGIGGIFLMAILSFLILLRKEKRKMREFFKKNGGPILEEAKNIKVFAKEELKLILKSENFIGKGCFGEGYKGLLGNEQVAVKKPISHSVLENEQFANEVKIQSQVIHKNIVRLIGCCLEVDTPMLVYEFLSRGSLDDVLHNNNEMPLNLSVRLSIAAQSADGLAYMHPKTHTKILHGDVKPANILLDDKFAPKISDFGISRLIARDKQHTQFIIGDMSYMDPVYLQTGLLTEKSDVYSFGVVILELISRKKATRSESSGLVNSFLEAHKKEKKATELFDKEIAIPEDLELLDSLAGIVVECLDLDVDKRPAMTEIAHRLLVLNQSRISSVVNLAVS